MQLQYVKCKLGSLSSISVASAVNDTAAQKQGKKNHTKCNEQGVWESRKD